MRMRRRRDGARENDVGAKKREEEIDGEGRENGDVKGAENGVGRRSALVDHRSENGGARWLLVRNEEGEEGEWGKGRTSAGNARRSAGSQTRRVTRSGMLGKADSQLPCPSLRE